MTEKSSENNASDAGKTENEEMSFADLFEMEENSSVSKVGDVIMGTIVGIVDDHVLVDIGDKAESYIPLSELILAMPLKSSWKKEKRKAGCCYPAKKQLVSKYGKK
jgi:exosome complex RNA-binding protein Rrp4